ncbi:MAG: hypothetical protein ABI442_14355 [Gemmatimonadaceae bacterium]
MTIAIAFAAALPTIATAQNGRGFNDSWFWGIKGGGFVLADSGQKYIQSPLAGIDWMITRTHGGLYVSGAQAFFSQHTYTLRDPNFPSDSGLRPITIKNLRKLDVAVMGFPGEHLKFHPYAGVGFTLSEVGTAAPVGPFSNSDQLTFANNVIDQERAAFSPLIIVGAQYRLSRMSVFGQGTVSPAQKSFILYNQRPWNFGYEFGLRYNVGTSIDKD